MNVCLFPLSSCSRCSVRRLAVCVGIALLFVVMGLLVMSVTLPGFLCLPRSPSSPDEVQVVVAAYRENLDWLRTKVPFENIVVYAKDPHAARTSYPRIELPNVGRCDHTYLYHICANYDRLAPITLFCTGSTWEIPCKRLKWHWLAPRLGHTLVKGFVGVVAWLPKTRDFQMKRYQTMSKSNRKDDSRVIPATDRPFGEWYRARFNRTCPVLINYHGLFAVSCESIRSVPLKRWRELRDELSVGDNLEVGHFMERTWFSLLTQKHDLNDQMNDLYF